MWQYYPIQYLWNPYCDHFSKQKCSWMTFSILTLLFNFKISLPETQLLFRIRILILLMFTWVNSTCSHGGHCSLCHSCPWIQQIISYNCVFESASSPNYTLRLWWISVLSLLSADLWLYIAVPNSHLHPWMPSCRMTVHVCKYGQGGGETCKMTAQKRYWPIL
jgi:hypothetical protein